MSPFGHYIFLFICLNVLNAFSENLYNLYFNGLNVVKDDLIYCVDMIRLSCHVPYSVFNKKINSRLSFYDEFLTSWISSRITDFYYNFNYCDKDCSFWFGFISNKEKISGKRADGDEKRMRER